MDLSQGVFSTPTYCVCTEAVQHSTLCDGFEGWAPQDAVHSLPQEVAVAELWRHVESQLLQLPVVGIRHAWEAHAEPESEREEFWQTVGIYTTVLFNTEIPRGGWGEQGSNNHKSVTLRKVLVWSRLQCNSEHVPLTCNRRRRSCWSVTSCVKTKQDDKKIENKLCFCRVYGNSSPMMVRKPGMFTVCKKEQLIQSSDYLWESCYTERGGSQMQKKRQEGSWGGYCLCVKIKRSSWIGSEAACLHLFHALIYEHKRCELF